MVHLILGTLAFIGLATIESAVAVNWNGNNWALNCDFQGNDIKTVSTPGEQCGGTCANTKGCTHWSYVTPNICKLKSGAVSQNNAVASSANGASCGIPAATAQSNSNSGSSSSNSGALPGKTTRYWDCCKPSCAWPGKIPAGQAAPNQAVVKTCNVKDGVSVVDPNSQSACGSGPAVVCNSNVPIVVNSTLAYGFGVGKQPGLGEDKLCCACYKLVFTQAPLVGKAMIVQITNTGADVADGQFDLQIPGGGVGLFNACTKQWNAPQNGWGAQYGGVGSAAECNALPTQIRNGCQFRFGSWFQGANNPTMTYQRVKCPQQLTDISGCKRSDGPDQ
jgi:hypothetical protein